MGPARNAPSVVPVVADTLLAVQFGQIVDIKVVPVGKTGQSEAYIHFADAESVDQVLTPENLGALPCQVARMVVKGKKAADKGLEEVYGEHAITVMNMPCLIETYLLEEYFGEFGPILHIEIPEPFKGSVDIYFCGEEWVESALLVSDHSVDGIPVEVVPKTFSRTETGSTAINALLPSNDGDDEIQVNTTHVWKGMQSGNRFAGFEPEDEELAAALKASTKGPLLEKYAQ